MLLMLVLFGCISLAGSLKRSSCLPQMIAKLAKLVVFFWPYRGNGPSSENLLSTVS